MRVEYGLHAPIQILLYTQRQILPIDLGRHATFIFPVAVPRPDYTRPPFQPLYRRIEVIVLLTICTGSRLKINQVKEFVINYSALF